MLNNKRAQIGTTITWVTATIIVIVILIISIFIAQIYSGQQSKIFPDKETDLVAKESLFAYLQTKTADGGIIYDNFLEQNFDLDDFNDGDLREKIFQGFYLGYYEAIMFDLVDNVNNCFAFNFRGNLFEMVFLNEEKCVRLNLIDLKYVLRTK